jgi:hypothetical protein
LKVRQNAQDLEEGQREKEEEKEERKIPLPNTHFTPKMNLGPDIFATVDDRVP